MRKCAHAARKERAACFRKMPKLKKAREEKRAGGRSPTKSRAYCIRRFCDLQRQTTTDTSEAGRSSARSSYLSKICLLASGASGKSTNEIFSARSFHIPPPARKRTQACHFDADGCTTARGWSSPSVPFRGYRFLKLSEAPFGYIGTDHCR
jgi:hypothetical protein